MMLRSFVFTDQFTEPVHGILIWQLTLTSLGLAFLWWRIYNRRTQAARSDPLAKRAPLIKSPSVDGLIDYCFDRCDSFISIFFRMGECHWYAGERNTSNTSAIIQAWSRTLEHIHRLLATRVDYHRSQHCQSTWRSDEHRRSVRIKTESPIPLEQNRRHC